MAVTVGHEFPPKSFYIDPTRVEDFVTALGVDPEPGFAPHPGAPVPPGFLMYVTTYGADAVHDAFDLPWYRALFGATRYEFLTPLRIGDTVTVRPTVTGRTVRGELVFWELTCEYCDAGGAVAVRETSVTIDRTGHE
jgi:acyl dehydratase